MWWTSTGRAHGERELRARLKRRREIEVRELGGDERDRFGQAWETAQSTFVEHPSTGLRDADLLVQQVMRERGYPVERFEERAKMISVDHPDLVERYRAAHRTSTEVEEGRRRHRGHAPGDGRQPLPVRRPARGRRRGTDAADVSA